MLFPPDPENVSTMAQEPTGSDQPTLVTATELSVAVKKMAAKNTAPGPDGVPGRAMSLALSVLHEEMVEILNKCLREGIVFSCWKNARLVLLPKPGKELDSPLAFRPPKRSWKGFGKDTNDPDHGALEGHGSGSARPSIWLSPEKIYH